MINNTSYEKKIHGTPDFPIEYCYVDNNHQRYIMSAHWHKEFEIIRVLSGRFDVYLNNVQYTLMPDDIILVECGCLHRGVPNNCVYECIIFNPNMLTKKQNDIIVKYIFPISNSDVGVNRLLHRNDSGMYRVISALFSAMREKDEFFELEVFSLLYKLFGYLYKDKNITNASKLPHSHQAHLINNILDWLDNNYTTPITLKSVASFAGISEKYLCRIFKEYTGKTVISYINELRIEHASKEITQNAKSVTRAALDSGFNDLSYFSKTFKKYKGIVPQQYKAQYKL